MDDFSVDLARWREQQLKPQPSKVIPAKPKAYAELTSDQKRKIIRYLMCFSKGVVEDGDFWGTMSQADINDQYDAYRNAIDRFIEEMKETLLSMI